MFSFDFAHIGFLSPLTVNKMYWADRDFHRFVWRNNPKDPLLDYRMTRITFGVSATPKPIFSTGGFLLRKVEL